VSVATPCGSDAARTARQLVEEALRAGAGEAEAYVQEGRELQVRVAAGCIDFLKQAHRRGAGLRVFLDRRPGFVWSSDFRPAGLRELAQRAVTLARFGVADEHAGLPEAAWLCQDCASAELELYDPQVAALAPDACVERALAMERAALAVDPRVRRTQICGASRFAGRTALASTRGADLVYEATSAGLFVTALAEDRDGKQYGWSEGGAWRYLADAPDPEALGRAAGRRALRRLGPRRVAPERVPVVMHPDVAESWIGSVASAFSGEEVLKRASYLHDRLGEPIASPLVTLVDDGRRRRGIGSAPFDGEGIATQRTVLVDRGTCAAFLYDAHAARQAGTRPTGSGRRGYSSPPAIGTHDLTLLPGDASLEELLRPVQRGFYYVDSGSFGYDPTTGDYSFQAAGYWIERGEIAFPVEGVTVASTTLEMLRGIEAVGRDVDRKSEVTCPALRIASMTVGA
jgi:PmbA protein